jgi:subtilisin family serine protease
MVASLIGARGNDGLGMVGVAWNVRIMPLVALDASGGGDTQNIIQAVRYATNMGADVINLSLAGSEEDPSLTEMIERAAGAGVVVVAAIGNDDTEKAGGNIDEKPSYPACGERQQDSVIGVGGTDALDQKAPYANFGKRCTDISAPAYDILADRPSYERGLRAATNLSGSVMNYREGTIGTSVAAPLVAGAAALLKSIHPTWTVTQIRERLYATADPLTQDQVPGQKTVLGYGRLNIGRALLDPVVTSTPSPESKPLLPVAKKGSKKKSVPVALPPASPARTDTSRITP